MRIFSKYEFIYTNTYTYIYYIYYIYILNLYIFRNVQPGMFGPKKERKKAKHGARCTEVAGSTLQFGVGETYHLPKDRGHR